MHSNTAAQLVRELTPDIVIARCGKPLNGHTADHTHAIGEHMLVYNNPSVGEVVLAFTPAGNGYKISMNLNGYGTARHISDAAAQIAALPCLANRSK